MNGTGKSIRPVKQGITASETGSPGLLDASPSLASDPDPQSESTSSGECHRSRNFFPLYGHSVVPEHSLIV
jgi:hypothetical protein